MADYLAEVVMPEERTDEIIEENMNIESEEDLELELEEGEPTPTDRDWETTSAK